MGPRFLVLFGALTGCSSPFGALQAGPAALEDSAAGDSGDTDTAPDPFVDAPIVGWVNDVQGLPLAGATVDLDGTSVTTGNDGAFEFDPPDGAATLTVSWEGGYPLSRSLPNGTAAVRVGVLPRGTGGAIEALDGGSVTAPDDSTVEVPAGALGAGGVIAVSFTPFAVDIAGVHSLPAGAATAEGWAVVVAAADIGFADADGEVAPTAPVSVRLKVPGGQATGTEAALFVEAGGVWKEVGTAALDYAGGGPWADFTVTEGGVYGVGTAYAAGCGTVLVTDTSGKPVAGADVRALVRATSASERSWLASTVSRDDGTACLPTPVGPVDIWASGPAAGPIPTYGLLETTGGPGDPETCGDCADLGSLVLAPAGCASGTFYGADGTKLADTPFSWGEGAPELSGPEGVMAFYARAGADLVLRGPGGRADPFIPLPGSTIAADDCTRLGNLQMTRHAVEIDVASSGIPVTDGEAWSVSDARGGVCLESTTGPTSYSASRLVGAQLVQVEADFTVETTGGTCWSGTRADGPDLTFPEPGCVRGTVYDADGEPLSGVAITSSAFDSATTDAGGDFCVATGGGGVASVWADGYAVTSTADSGPMECSDLCPSVSLYPDVGSVPPVVVATDEALYRVEDADTVTAILDTDDAWLGDIHDLDVSTDLIVFIHYSSLVYRSSTTGADYDDFGEGNWSSVRISPDGSQVALLGYSGNAIVKVYKADESSSIQVSSTAAVDSEGIAWSPDGDRLASTRKDEKIEVLNADASGTALTITSSLCGKPVWFDDVTVAVYCDGDAWLANADGTGSTPWAAEAGLDERIRDVSGGRVVYTLDDELHTADLDGDNDAILYIGAPGTEYSYVRWDPDADWVLAIVDDPASGVDVLAIRDTIPYQVVPITDSPDVVEDAADWVK